MAALAPMDSVDMGQEIDPNASPADSIDTNTTPNTVFSPPESPIHENGPPKEPRALAQNKLAALTLEEKVCCAVCQL